MNEISYLGNTLLAAALLGYQWLTDDRKMHRKMVGFLGVLVAGVGLLGDYWITQWNPLVNGVIFVFLGCHLGFIGIYQVESCTKQKLD